MRCKNLTIAEISSVCKVGMLKPVEPNLIKGRREKYKRQLFYTVNKKSCTNFEPTKKALESWIGQVSKD
jgi:hypothetical protein